MFQIAVRYHQGGQFARAEALYRQVIEAQPNHCLALDLLGLLEHQTGRSHAALETIQQASSLDPSSPVFHHHRGVVLRALGNLSEARLAQEEAVRLNPNYADAHYALGLIFRDLKDFDPAAACFAQVIHFHPHYPEVRHNLGHALRASGKLKEAEALFRQALAEQPSATEALTNLGAVLKEQNRVEEALQCWRKILEMQPRDADTHWNLALGLLLLGRFAEGWQELEWRYQRHDPTLRPRTFPQPLWRGEPLAGKVILLHAEQGLGDAIQFVRYAALVAARKAWVIVACAPELKSLFQTIPNLAGIVADDEKQAPSFDCHLPLLSLPNVFETTRETIPHQVPYLFPPPNNTPNHILCKPGRLKVGLVWAGNPKHQNDRQRSLAPELFHTVLTMPDAAFYSLQVGRPAVEFERLKAFGQVMDLSSHWHDFADTAADIQQLDLVITVDTAVAHLAGALGRPVWTLLPFSPDWRWLLGRKDSPWYPTMRLFRQPAHGAWEPVMQEVKKELRELLSTGP